MRHLLPLAAIAACVSWPLAALEPEDLRLGMTELEAASVFTSLRSCANYILEEAPGSLAWDAKLFGRDARAEVSFVEGRAASVLVRVFLAAGDDGASLYDQLVGDKERALGLPNRRGRDLVEWSRDGAVTAIERDPRPTGGEIRIAHRLLKPQGSADRAAPPFSSARGE